MHEYSLVEAMLDQVDAIRIAQQADRVCSIRVGIGEFAGVEPDLFVDAFDLLRFSFENKGPTAARRPIGAMKPAVTNGTVQGGRTDQPSTTSDSCHASGPAGHAGISEKFAWDQTDLQMHVIPLEARCSQCHRVFHVENFNFQCPECESPDLTILQGEDLILESVTLEAT